MRKIAFFSLLLLLTGVLTGSAQSHPIKVSVVNAKGKPIPGRTLISMGSAPSYQHVNKAGTLIVQALPNDSIYVTVDQHMGTIPVDASTSEVSVVVSKGKMYKAVNGKATDFEYEVYELPSFNQGNNAAMANLHLYPTLLDYIQARYPTIRVKSDGQAYMMALGSANAEAGRVSSPPVLVILDGSPQRSFLTVSEKVRPADVTSFIVKKMDVLYGTRGAGGIIEITLRKGGE